MKKLNCIIIDDEPLACKGLTEYIGEIDSLELLAAVQNPAEAIKHLGQADLMYLDINMPKISGIDFLKQLKNPPLTIITTAYQQYALEGFELDVIDYLLKPVSFTRFLKATTKAIEYYKLLHPENAQVKSSDYFFVKSNGILEKVFLADIVVIESLSNYITIHCKDRKLIAYLTLKQILETLPSEFVQVNKSFIVSIPMVEKIDRDELILKGLTIPVGSNYKESVLQRVVGSKMLKR